MTAALAFEIGLAALLLVIAVWTIAARDAFTAVVVFVVYGLLLAIVWTDLAAADIALTEVAIGSGLTGVLLLGAAARLRTIATPAAEYPGKSLRLGAALLSAIVAVGLAAGVLFLPDPAPTLAPAAAANASATGLGNPVTNVLMAFRAMDTMLEKVVLLLVLIGVWSLMPDRLWGERLSIGRNGPRRQADPGDMLAFLARLLPPVGIVVGIYVLAAGANHPGGAFQAGTILAAMWLLAIMAGLTDAPPLSRRRLRLVLVAGPAVFLVIGLGGLWLGSGFLAYPAAFAKLLILAIECAMTLTIAATLGLLAGAPERGPET
jgi:multisubunit Na+/H+ antiporter MnhB subunit